MKGSIYYSEFSNTFVIISPLPFFEFQIEYVAGLYFAGREQLIELLVSEQYELIGYV
jgi:hypothetical protein